MRPAFSSTRQAAAFASLLLALILLPTIMGKGLLPPRDQVYSSLSWGTGAYPYLHDQIFEEKKDIDIAFMGSSRMWWGIDTPQMEAKLSQKLGRGTVVRSLCWNSPGYDAFYFIMRDLLEHRKVRMIVLCDCSTGAGNTAHPWANFFFRLGDNAEGLAGLSLRSKISFYSSAILGMPRNLLGLFRANLPEISSDKIAWQGSMLFSGIKNPDLRLGSLAVPLISGRTFSSYASPVGDKPSDVRIYSEANRADFRFSDNLVWPMQAAFTRKIAALAQAHGVKLAYLHLPQRTEDRSPVIEEPVFWPDLFDRDLTMMGIPPAKLFDGISDDGVNKLFFNYEHLNQNGQEYFTAVIAPRLAQIYEDQTKP